MPGSAAEVHQTPFRQQEDGVPLRKGVFIHLRFDILMDYTGIANQILDLDLVVEVTDVADNSLVLHLFHMLYTDDVAVTSGGYVDISLVKRIFQGGHLKSFHRRLQRTDRVDLSNQNPCAEAAHGLRTALSHIAITADHNRLAGDHHVKRTL